MNHYVGLDVSLKTVFICIVNEKGKVVKEQEFASTPEVIGGFLLGTGLKIEKVGLESGSLTHYLKKGLQKMGFEVIAMEARKMAAILATVNLLHNLNFVPVCASCYVNLSSHTITPLTIFLIDHLMSFVLP